MTFNDRTIDYEKLKRKLNETLGLLAQKEIDIKEGLKLKAYEILVVKEKHDELVKQSLLTKSHYEGLVKEKTKVITDLKLKEEKDIDKMISMEKQLKFLNEIVYKRNQSIQTIHMLAPKGPTFNGRPTFVNPMYLKKAQYEKPCLYEIPYNQYDPANRLVPDREETLTLEKESRSKLNKDLVRPYDYTKLNSLYEIFKPASQEYHEQLAHANEVRKKIELVDQAWEKHSHNHFRAPTALDMEVLIKTCLMPLAIKTQNDSFNIWYKNFKFESAMKTRTCNKCSKATHEKMKGKSVDTNFEKQSILGKLPLQPIRNQPVVRQPTAYKSEQSQLPRHRIQVGVLHDLTKLVTPHSKPYDVNAPGPSRKSPKHVSFQSPREFVGSNDMVHN
ncbi:hypothetical protein Tco_0520299 [Tanacetum coccineum]